MRIEAKDSFVKTLKKEPMKALALKRTWSDITPQENKVDPPVVKLGGGEIAVVFDFGDRQMVRVDVREGRRYWYASHYEYEEINLPGTPLFGKIRKV